MPTTLRAAATQALEALKYHQEQTRPIWSTTEAIEALNAALEERFCDNHCTWLDHAAGCVRAEPVQEPVAWKDKYYESLHHQDFGNSIPLYAAPPQRLPLTEEEMLNIIDDNLEGGSLLDVARAIEAAHGIGGKT